MSRIVRLQAVLLGDGVPLLHCRVAETWAERAQGLQGYAGLTDETGMWFPHQNELASIHMGSVAFPIDVLFIRGNTVAQIVSNILPGTPGRWVLDRCDGVLEVRGGWCNDYGVTVGTRIEEQ